MRSVLIIGAGFSGTVVAARLLRSGAPLRVMLAESSNFARGVAYSTTELHHLLNVPAAKMSALDDDVGHFQRWLTATHPKEFPEAAAATMYAPRRYYGDYLTALLEESSRGAGAQLQKIPHAVTALTFDGKIFTAVLDDGTKVTAENAVLACGDFPPHESGIERHAPHTHRHLIRDAWGSELPATASALLLGTGLTMMDAALTLAAKNPKCTMWGISRRGSVSHAHRTYSGTHSTDLSRHEGLRARLRAFRGEIRAAQEKNIDWRAVIDSLRGSTPQLWAALTETEKRRFLRHLRPYWDSHRHRVAPEVGKKIDELRGTGRLTIFAGRVTAITAAGDDAITVSIKRRGGGIEKVTVNYLINCTGSHRRVSDLPNPLLRSLFAQKMVQEGETGLGLATDGEGKLVGASGDNIPLYLVGAFRRDGLWESTAVPELRVQAAKVAEKIARG